MKFVQAVFEALVIIAVIFYSIIGFLAVNFPAVILFNIGRDEFIVRDIESKKDSMALYTSTEGAELLLPKGWYVIGDTVNLVPDYRLSE